MKKNPVIPFGLIAVLGILAIIIMGGVGVSQVQHAEGEGESEEATMDPASLVENNNCISCHGGDLTGTGTAPDLTNLQDKYSMDELVDIINNGVEGSNLMTGDYANAEEAEVIAEWLLNGQE
ncbi:c-type cytochrome [Tenuibacillus multivorans]|uniref:Cytochrome c550 n=1 Tax=Tenuibacillus multivorans TaxID=237069 RepID=A0A1G9ZCN1_9BACI|nr:cytochrome c [Tenuibacillus multivorans]GEL78303.1 cytochrome c [Tenuibacillus multivorans]SDN18935.1 cytochrome c550 [Tenuibacillus multivorans]